MAKPAFQNNEIPAWVEGVLTPVDKLSVHHRGLFHKAVSVFIIVGQDILLQQRAAGKYHTPLLWANTCCTHPLWEEAPLDCAVRRLNEELGLTGITPVWRDQIEYRADVGDGMIEHERVDLFVAEMAERVVPQPNPDEVAAVRWLSRHDLRTEIDATPEVFTPWLRVYIAEHAERIFD